MKMMFPSETLVCLLKVVMDYIVAKKVVFVFTRIMKMSSGHNEKLCTFFQHIIIKLWNIIDWVYDHIKRIQKNVSMTLKSSSASDNYELLISASSVD